MLTKIAVDGFRSLRGFSLDFKPGLNVLVGPNGSGKSNVIRFLEFVSFTHEGRLIESVSKAGGAGEIFYRTPAEQFSKEMSFTIEGSVFVDVDDEISNNYTLDYKYYASIRIAKDFSSIYYPVQKISLDFYEGNLLPPLDDVREESRRCSIDIESHLNNSDKMEFIVSRSGDHSHFTDDDFDVMTRSDGFTRQAREGSLINIVNYSVQSLRQVRYDLQVGKVYNINPAAVREPEDIAESPYIKSNGSGLAATLFSLKQIDESRFFHPAFYPRPVPHRLKILNEIKSYVRLVNENIIDIDVKYDTFDNKLKVFSTVKSDVEPIVIPLALLSDGTIKWLCLVAALLSGSSTFSLEEPENFLHPRMQIEFIEIIRTLLQPSGSLKTVIITTHSETVLNTLRPEEIIMLQMKLSRTEASRIGDPDELNKNIRESGFGLGFYYITGSM